MKKSVYIFFLFAYSIAVAQIKDTVPTQDNDYYLVIKDTTTIDLPPVTIYPRHKFKSNLDKRYYYWFRKKVFKAYPFAALASKRIDSLNVRISKIESGRKKTKYIKIVQKYIEDKFTEELKKLTKTEGRILVKLIHRQTGKTAYETIKSLRSGFKAFFYNLKANIFSLSLKLEYDPSNVNEDFLIEDVLQRAFNTGKLEEQKSKLNFDAKKIIDSKKGDINVERYKKMFAKK